MKKTTTSYIAEAVHGRLCNGSGSNVITDVVIDSRKAGPDNVFFAIIGEKNDAHRFLPDVCKNGCKAVVISDPEWAEKIQKDADAADVSVILVQDTTRALMDLAKQYLVDWPELHRVAITGSVGKTSTKDMLCAVLGSKFRTEKTQGNLNNQYGVPLTIFRLKDDTEAAVIEMGAGEGTHMSDLADIVKPEVSVITTIGTSHLEIFHSREKLTEEKLNTAAYFEGGETLIVNADCDMLTPEVIQRIHGDKGKLLTIGSKDNNNYILYNVCDMGIDGVKCTLDICVEQSRKTVELTLPIIGAHNLFNAALAVAAGGVYGIEAEDAVRAIDSTRLTGKRLEVQRSEAVTVINDTYNASPESMKAAVEVLSASRATRRVAILGDMYELGSDEAELHKSVGTVVREKKIDLLITVGPMAKNIAEGAEGGDTIVVSFDDKADALDHIPALIKKEDLILVKASRGMALEDIAACILEQDR